MRTTSEKRKAVARIRPYVEKARRFSGWSFADIETVPIGPGLPSDYEKRARDLLRNVRSVVDMGTGGGELFERLLRGYRGRAFATESWTRNVQVAVDRLWPTGCAVVKADSLRLPFRDASFELVLDRHEELDPPEVARILKDGGRVLTQQVGRRNWDELRAFFPRMRDFGPLFDVYRRGFEEARLSITQAEEHEMRIAYRGLGDVVFMLCVSPWDIPRFAPLEADLDALLDMEESLHTEDGIVLTESRFVIEAQKN